MSFQLYSLATSPETITGDPALFPFSLATNIRMRMFRALPGQSVYSVSRFRVMARLNCNGHGTAAPRASQCTCVHNTGGNNCQQCLPLYNNNPFVRWTTSTPFGCTACECYGHADACTYSSALEIGVCDDCEDFTTGEQCDSCDDGHFRARGVALSADDVCTACDCDTSGATSAVCIGDAFSTSGGEPGTCLCKARVTGSRCDACLSGFTNLQASNALGCDTCSTCNASGVTPSNTCLGGECACKTRVTGILCDTCVAGTYGLSSGNPAGCALCDCAANGTASGGAPCDATTGQCPCMPGWTGRQCEDCASGYRHNGTTCVACGCHSSGSLSAECSGDGDCTCRTGYAGNQCDRCDVGYTVSAEDASVCTACVCDRDGTEAATLGQCNATTGQCACKVHVTGTSCDTCVDGFSVLDGLNPVGCSGTPQNLSVPTFELQGPAILVTWQPPAVPAGPIVRYELYRSAVLVFNGSDVSVLDTAVLPGRSYTYFLFAFTAAGSVDSAPLSVITPDAPPADVGAITVSNQTQSTIGVAWAAPGFPNGGSLQYVIYAEYSDEFGSAASLRFVTSTSGSGPYGMTLRGFSPFTQYTLLLEACTSAGCTNGSSTAITTLSAL